VGEVDSETRTKQTYDQSAAGLADYFAGIGPRNKDIDIAFELVNKTQPIVLELGCGDGRDAGYILSRANNYVGIDYSNELIKIAQHRFPAEAEKFITADIRNLPAEVSKENDIIFAFASLLHLNPEDMRRVIADAASRLAKGGVLYISLKKSDKHQELIKEDKFGWRLFHLYSPAEIANMVPQNMELALEDEQRIGSTDWFTVAFTKQNNDI
jgi:SAM-dependent methyltransferase